MSSAPADTSAPSRGRWHEEFQALDVVRKISTRDGTKLCGLCTRPGEKVVTLERSEHSDGNRARLAGAIWCGAWTCPYCQGRHRFKRSIDVAQTLRGALAAKPGRRAWLVTFTLQHKKKDALADLLAAMDKGWTSVMRGRAGQADRDAGVVGTIRALELTVGANGWHPHYHVIVIADGWSTIKAEEVFNGWEERWLSKVPGLEKLAVDFREIEGNADAVAKYITGSEALQIDQVEGAAMELTRTDWKKARGENMSLREVYAALVETKKLRDTDKDAAAMYRLLVQRFREFERATKGRRWVVVAQSLKEWRPDADQLATLITEAVADAEEKLDWKPLTTLTRAELRAIGRCGRLAKLLALAADGDTLAIAVLAAKCLTEHPPSWWWRKRGSSSPGGQIAFGV